MQKVTPSKTQREFCGSGLSLWQFSSHFAHHERDYWYLNFQSAGNSHPIIDQIVTLIDQCCTLTIRRLTKSQDEEPPPQAT